MKISQWLFFSLLVAAVLLGGCARLDGQRIANTLAAPNYIEDPSAPGTFESVVEPAPPEEVRSFPTISQGDYSLSLKDVELSEALSILSKDSPVPIVTEAGVGGRVTVNIKNKPLGDLLFTMLRPLGLTAKLEDGMILVGPAGLVTQSFVVNYLKDKRTSSSVTNASISAGSSSGSSSLDNSSSSGGSQGNVRVTTSGGGDFWSEVIKGIESIVYGSDKKDNSTGNNVVTNQLSGIIHVTAPQETVKRVSSYLASIEKEIKRQVLIQAHIVEVELNDEFSLGIDWSAIFDHLKGSIALDMMPTLNPANSSNSFVLNIDTSSFNLLLDTFKEQGGLNMLASPKISTLNNQKAVIKLTTKEVTWVQSVLRSNTVGGSDLVITTPQIDEVGLFLDVTPNIAASGNITMQVHPSITEVKNESFSPDGSSSKPIITVREIDSIIDVRSGQTMVIGGLISEKTSNVKRGVPFLGDLPGIGWFFSNYKQVKRKTELVIFLTPYILNKSVIESIRTEHENRLWGSEGINQYVDQIMQ